MNNSVAPTHWVIKWYSKKRENWVISKSRAHSWYSPENNTNKKEKEIKSTFHYTGSFHGKRSRVSGSLDSMREKQRTVSSHSVLSHFLTFNLLFAQTEYGENAESKADQQVRSHVIYMDTELGHAIDSWVPIMPVFSTLIKLVAVCLFAFFFVTATPKNHCPSLKTGTVKQDRMTFIGNVTRLSWNSDNGMQSNHGMCRLLIRNKVTPPRLKFQSDWANLMGTEYLHGAILIGLLFDLICIIAPGENQRWTLGPDN